MTDTETVVALISRDNAVTREFFYVRCRPLLTAVLRAAGPEGAEYDEFVSELYAYLMADDAAKLRLFEGRSTIFQWLKVVATRFLLRKRADMIENISKEPLYESGDTADGGDGIDDSAEATARALDVETLLDAMPNARYALVLRRLILDEAEPETCAAELGVNVANLYNIKRRAIAMLRRVASKYKYYEQ